MPYDARQVANFLLDASVKDRRPITHLGLQKVLYFAHAWHLAKYSTPLVAQKFEAWKYGPVVRVIFDQLKIFKSQPILYKLQIVEPQSGEFREATYSFGEELSRFLQDIYEYYGKIDPRKLIDLTHEPDGPWEKVWKSGAGRSVVGMYIPDDAIKLWILREGGREGSIRH